MEDIENLINSLGESVNDVKVKQNPNNGNVKISFTSYGQNVNLIYNPNDPTSLDNFFLVGRGTYDGSPGDGNFDGDVAKAAFESSNPVDYTTITIAGTSQDSRVQVDSTCNQAMSMLKKYYDDPFATQDTSSKTQTYSSAVVSGASANGQNTVISVQEYMNSMKTDDAGVKRPIHIMLFDSAYADSNGGRERCEMFTKALLKNDEVVNYMKDSNSVIFAYPQAYNGQKTLYNQAAGQLIKVNDEGIAVVMCFNEDNRNHSTIYGDYDSRMAQSNIYNASAEDEARLGEQKRVMAMDFSPTGNAYLDKNEYQFFDENGELHDLPAERINEFVDAYYNDRLGEFIEKIDNNEPYELTSHDLLSGQVKVVYSSVINNLGGIISLINNTNFNDAKTRVIGSNSTADLFNNLSSSNNYLFGLSSNLLNGISNDVNNIEQMLTNWAKTDADLANLANSLNNGNLNASLVGDSFTMDSMHFSEITSSFSGLFSGRVSEGSVGKISMSDLGSMFNGTTLTGSLGNLLDSEISDARNLQNSINSLISNPNIASPGWNSMLNRLNFYEGCCEVRGWAAETLKAAYEKAFKIIYDHIYPDEDMDDSQIPEYVDKIEKLTKDINQAIFTIAALKAQNNVLSAVGPNCTTWYDEKGNECGYCDYSPVYAARAQIATNNALIESTTRAKEIAEEAREEAKIYLNRLRELSVKMNEANNIINDAINQIESKYASEVYHVDTPRLSSIASVAGASTPLFDQVTATDVNPIAGGEFSSVIDNKTEVFSSSVDKGAFFAKDVISNRVTDNESSLATNETPIKASSGGTFLGDSIANIQATAGTPSQANAPTLDEEKRASYSAAAMAASTVGVSALSGADMTTHSNNGTSVFQGVKEKISGLFSKDNSSNNSTIGGSFMSEKPSIESSTSNATSSTSSNSNVNIDYKTNNALSGAEHNSNINGGVNFHTTNASSSTSNGGTFLGEKASDIKDTIDNAPTYSGEGPSKVSVDIANKGKNALNGAEINVAGNNSSSIISKAKEWGQGLFNVEDNHAKIEVESEGGGSASFDEPSVNLNTKEGTSFKPVDSSFTMEDEPVSRPGSSANIMPDDTQAKGSETIDAISGAAPSISKPAGGTYVPDKPTSNINLPTKDDVVNRQNNSISQTTSENDFASKVAAGASKINEVNSSKFNDNTSGITASTQSSNVGSGQYGGGYSGGYSSGGSSSSGSASSIPSTPNVTVTRASTDSVVTPVTNEVVTPTIKDVIPSTPEVNTQTNNQNQINIITSKTDNTPTTPVIPSTNTESNVKDTVVTPKEDIDILFPNEEIKDVIKVKPVTPNKPSSNNHSSISHISPTKPVTGNKETTQTEIVSPEVPTYVDNKDNFVPETEPVAVEPEITQNVTPSVSLNGTLKDETIKGNNDTLKTVGTVAGVGLALGAAAYGINQLTNKDKDDKYEYDDEKGPDNQNIFKEYIDNDEQLTAFEES